MKRPRLRKWAKWACTLAAGAAGALAVFSGLYSCSYFAMTDSGDTAWSVTLGCGLMTLDRSHGWRTMLPKPRLGWSGSRADLWYWGRSGELNAPGSRMDWHAGVLYVPFQTGWNTGVSVLYPVALTLIPAALLWYADRRRVKPGSCGGCGYDRRGLAVGVKCPECGTLPAK